MTSLIKKSVVLALAVLALISCENPIQNGLGSRVDITGPDITVLDPEAGDYLNGLVNFNVFADDDIKVESVFVYAAMEGNFHKESPQWIGISPPASGKIWTWQKNTTNEEDGILLARFRAVDNTGKTSETETLSYTIKNLPPRIDLNIPNFSLKDRTRLLEEELAIANNGLSIDSGGVLIGYATDIQGVRYQSPKIKLWREGTPKPSYWSDVDVPVWEDIDPASSLASSKGREFRYYITDHQEPGDPRLAAPMEVGDYRVQFQVTDTSKGEGISSIFPPSYTIDGIDYDYLKIHVVPSYETPHLDVSFTPNNTYQGEAFIVEAKASHSMGIDGIDLLVKKSGETTLHTLAWEANTENLQDLDINGTATKSRTVESFFIIPGGYYVKTDGDTFLFDSGTYEFSVQAVSKAGARFSHTQTIYIDNTRPTVQITRIAPGVYVDPSNIDYYTLNHEQDRPFFTVDNALNIQEAYIVNGKVKINVAPFDQNGLGIYEVDAAGREIRRLRYLLARVNYTPAELADPGLQSAKLASILPLRNGVLDRDDMYDALPNEEGVWRPHGDKGGEWMAGFMDKLPKPPLTGSIDISSPAADMITLDTNLAVPGNEGELYLFITAKDKANNLAALLKGADTIGYHLRVNQGSDEPYIKFTDLKNVTAVGDLKRGNNVLDSDNTIRGSLEDDDGITTMGSPNSVQFFLSRLRPGAAASPIPSDWDGPHLVPNNDMLQNQTGKSLNFEFTRTDLGMAFSEPKLLDGIYKLEVTLSDDPLLKDGLPAATTHVVRCFAYDAATPAIDIITPQNYAFIGTDFTMEVEVFDANGPLHLEIRPPKLADLPPANATAQFWDLNYIDWISTQPSNIWFTPGTVYGDYGARRRAEIPQDIYNDTQLVALLNTVKTDITNITGPTPVASVPVVTSVWKFKISDLDQDHLTVGVRGLDRFLKESEKTLTLKFDQIPPVIESTYPLDPTSPAGTRTILTADWITGNSSFAGTAWDPTKREQNKEANSPTAGVPAADGAVLDVVYWNYRVGDSVKPPADLGQWEHATISNRDAPRTPWSVYIEAIPPDGVTPPPEGRYTLYVAAIDQTGKASLVSNGAGVVSPVNPPSAYTNDYAPGVNTIAINYGIDKTPPTVSDLLTGAPADTASVSAYTTERTAAFDMSCGIHDDNGLKSLVITQRKGNEPPITIHSAAYTGNDDSLTLTGLPRKTAADSFSPMEWDNHVPDGIYYYTITVTDVANQETTITRTIDVDTTAPAVKITSHHGAPLPGVPAYIFSDKLFLVGDVADAHPGSVYFWDGPSVSYPGSPGALTIPTTAAAAASSGWTKATGSPTTWNIDYTLPPEAPEGDRHIYIIAFDTLGHRNNGITYTDEDANVYPVLPTVSFDFPYALDTAPPQLTETYVANEDQKLVSANFLLRGLVGDANGVRSITVRQTLRGALPGDSHNLSYDVFNSWNTSISPQSLFPNGVYLKGPGTGQFSGLNLPWNTENKLKVDGTVDYPLPTLPWKNTGAPNNPVLAHDETSGEYDYTITAIDKFGRSTTLLRHVQVDVEPPVISFSPAPINKPQNSWFDLTSIIQGAGTDDLTGIASVFYWYGRGTVSGASYTPPPPPAYATLEDINNPPLTNPPKFWETASGNATWSVPLDISESSFAEGYYTLYVIAVDGAGNIGGALTTHAPLEYNFRVDKANPTIAETKVDQSIDVVYTSAPDNQSPLRKDYFDLNLDLYDSYGLDHVVIKQTKDNNPADPLSKSFTLPLSGTSVSPVLSSLPWKALYTQADADPVTLTAPDGVYDYEFTLWDGTYSDTDPTKRKSATITRKITVDNTKPTVAHISTPGEIYQTMNASMEIRGTAVDPAPGTIRRVLYWTGTATDTSSASDVPAYNPASPLPWKEVDYSTSGWSKEIILGSNEGQRVVAIIAEDKHGNVSDLKLYNAATNTNNVSVRFFYKDDSAPSFDVTLPDTKSRVDRSPQFPMDGYVQDTNAVDKIVLVQKKMNGAVADQTLEFTLNLNSAAPYKNQTQYWRFAGLPYSVTGGSQTPIFGSIGTSTSDRIIFTGTPYTGSGNFDYTITAYDVSGRSVFEQRYVTIDTTPPTAAISSSPTNPPAGSWFSQTQFIKGSAADTGSPQSGVVNVYYAITAPGDSTPAFNNFAAPDWKPARALSGWASWDITLQVDNTLDSLAEGQYKLHVVAVDGAGNIGSANGLNTAVSYLFNVDKADPIISETTIGSDVFRDDTVFTLGGPFSDSYGIDSIRITQTSVINGTTVTKTLKDHADAPTFNSSAYTQTTTDWSLLALPRNPGLSDTIIKNPAAWTIADGIYTYTITARDRAGKETTATRIITIDNSPPAITVSSPDAVASEGWTGDATITVTGTATDAAPGHVADVYYWLTDASVPVVPLNTVLDAAGNFIGATIWKKAQLISGTNNWSTGPYTLPLEGEQHLAAHARDSANHLSPGVTKTFWVDQADPSLTVTAKTTDTAALITGPTARAFKLSGDAWDTNGIKSVQIVQRKAGITNPLEVTVFTTTSFGGGDGKSAGAAKTWDMGSANALPRLQNSAGSTTPSLDDGAYTYYITLTDNSGRITKKELEINVDTTKPHTEAGAASDITVTVPTIPTAGDVGSWIRGAAVSIEGKAADSMPTGSTGTITPSGIEKVIYWASINGASELSVGALDQPGNSWKTAAYNAATTEWSATLVLANFGLSDGVNKLWVRAYDKAGNLSEAYTRTFGVDQANPELIETSVDTAASPLAELAYIKTGSFTLSGKILETNLDKLVITQQVRLSNGTFVDAPITIAEIEKTVMPGAGIAGNPYVWALSTPANQLPREYGNSSNPNAPLTDFTNVDATFVYGITAWDLMGNASAEVKRLVTIDNSGPLVTIGHPEQNASYQGTSIQIDGTVTDNTRVDQVRYIIENAATTLAALKARPGYPVSGWTAVEANKLVAGTWSAFIDFGALSITEGDLRLWVIATDGANWGGSNVTPGDPVSAAFTLDQARPEIGAITYTGTSTVSRNIYTQGGFSFEFDAWDSNKLPDSKLINAVTVTRSGVTLPLSAAQGLTITDGGASPDTVHVKVDQSGSYALSAGTYTYVITVTDKSGKTSVKETTVIVDTTPPELSLNSVTPVVTKTSGAVTTDYVNGLFWFNVSSSDDNGIYPYNIAEGENGSPQGGVKYYFVPTGTDSHPRTNPFTDTAGGTVLKPNPYEGVINTASVTSSTPYTLWIYSRDRAGRISYISRDLTIDQTTDTPVVNIPAMEGYNNTTNIFSLNPGTTGYPLVGIVSDDDNVNGANLKVYRSGAGASPDPNLETGWTLLTPADGLTELTQVTGSDKQWRFTYVVPTSLLDGTYKLRVVAEDKDKHYPNTNNQLPNPGVGGMGTITTPATVLIRPVYTFNVDAVKPEITVNTAPAAGYLEETYKTSKPIQGTVKEATLKAFRITIDGSRIVNASDTGELVLSGTGETKTWTLNMASAAFNALNDGPHSLLWTAEDAVGNTETLGRTFYKDSSGPDIIVTSLNEDQMYIIDSRGITNNVPFWFNPKTGLLTSPLPPDPSAALKTVADVITDGTPKLAGTFFDEYSTVFEPGAANRKFWYRFDYAGFSTDDTLTTWQEATGETFLAGFADLTGAEKSVRWQIPLSSADPTSPSYGLSQGYHHVDIKVLDRWGSNNGMNYQAPGDPAPLVYNFERIAFRLDSDPPEINLTAKDSSNKAIADGDTFGNLANPTDVVFNLLAKVTDVTLSSVKADIRVGNTILKKLGATPTDGTYTTSLGTIGTETIAGNTVKNLSIGVAFTQADMNALVAAAGPGSNIFTIVITAVDGAPREQKLEIRFKTDSTPARITTSNLVTNRSAGIANYPSVIIDAQPAIQGNISDDSGIGTARYKIDQYNYTTGVYTNTVSWTSLSASDFTNNFITMEAFTINLGAGHLGLTDGKYSISFELKDKASPSPNITEKINIVPSSYPGDDIADIEFFIDGAPPALETVNFKSPPFYSGTELTESSIDYMAVYIKASDANTITQIRGRLETDTAGTYPLIAAPYTDASMPSVNYRLLIRKDSCAEGLHNLTIEAKDGAGRTTAITKDFTLDKSNPILELIEPQYPNPDNHTIPAEITSQATIKGITADNSSVSKLYYLFGRTEVSAGTLAPASFPPNTTVSVNGKIWREFKAGIDKDGNTIAAASYITNPAITTNLDKAQGTGSLYSWSIKLPNSVDLTTDLAAGVGRYVSLRNGSTYLCDLPIRFMIIDSAGNIAYYDYTVIVNPKGDEPMVTFSQPNPAQTAVQNEVGGVIQVVGTAKDNDWIHRVVFRVLKGDDSPATPIFIDNGWTPDTETNTAYAALGDNRGGWFQAPILGAPGSNVSWSFNLNNNGGLNPESGSNGRLVTIQALAYDTSPFNHLAPKTMGEIAVVKVTFVNGLPFVVSNSTIITPDPKNGKPFAYTTNNQNIGGTFTITTRIRDDNGLKELTYHGENTTAWSTNIFSIVPPGGATNYAKPVTVVPAANLVSGTYYLVLEGPNRTNLPFKYDGTSASIPAGMVSASPALNETGDTPYNDTAHTAGKKGYIEYELRLRFDSTTLMNKDQQLFVNRAGHYALSILATDHTDFKMPLELTLNIDNFFPLGTYTGNGVAVGASYQLQGLAWDTGAGVTVQGIKKVVAWFSRGEQFIPLNEKAMGSGAAFRAAGDPITVAMGRTDTNSGTAPALTTINGGGSTIKFPDLRYTRKYVDNDGVTPNSSYYNLNSPYISGVEIDANEPTQDNDEDGFLEGMADAGTNYQWYGRIDTTKFYDGLLTVHYLVYDKAGNASYYSNTIFISNNPPKVTSVDIGTDVLNVGFTTDPRGHRTISANYGNTNFTVRNKQVSFKINISGDDGAKPFHYRFGYVTNRVSKPASALVTGKIYSIEAVGTVNWTAVGAPEGYGVGTTFMATDHTSFGAGSALELTISSLQANNTNAHEVTYNYTSSDFSAIADTTIPNDAWFVLRVYNSLKIPMIPDDGYMANGGDGHLGPDNTTPVYSVGPYGNPDRRFNTWDQPYDVVRIGLNVANTDTVKPEVKLWDFNPGGEAAGAAGAAQPPSSINLTPNAALSPNLLKGGLYNPKNHNRNIERSGHIEPRFAATQNSYFIEGNYGSATFAKDTLSGEVILRGFAYDDQRLGTVYLSINGVEFPILRSDDTTAYNAANPGSRGLLVPVSGQNASVYNQIDVAGHMAEWAYVWNTAALPAGLVAGDNVKVQVRVEDKRSSPNSSVTRLHPNTGEATNGSTILAGSNDGRYPLVLRNADGWRLDPAGDRGYNRIAVTLAPYLNSLQRDAGKGYNSLRSRQGWYSFSRGETIVAQGWNLKFPSANTTVTLDTATATVDAAVGAQTTTGITFTVPATAVSGNVKLLANGVPTVNDRNDNRNPWNREDYNLSVSGNDLWKDDRAAHIWQSDGTVGSDYTQINGSSMPTDPAMTMAPLTGTLWAAWSNTSNMAVYMNSNTSASYINVLTNTGGGGMENVDIYYAATQRSSGTNKDRPTMFFSSIRKYNNEWGVTRSGGIKGYDPDGSSPWENYYSANDSKQYNVEHTYHNQINDQFKQPRVVYRGDNMHVTYYDSKDKSMKYWFGRSGYRPSSGNYESNAVPGTVNGLTGVRTRHWVNLDGGDDAEDKDATSGTPAPLDRVRARTGGGAEGTNTFTRTSKTSLWSAIDLQKDGQPVIAYFDDYNARLRLAYADTAVNPQAGQWKVQYALPDTDDNYHFSGEYVSMQIDQTNNDAHLAFFKSNTTQLVYIRLKWDGGKYVPYGKSVIVDEAGANGKWVDLTLDRTNRPWISYIDITRGGNFDGVKMAYYDPSKHELGEHSYDINGVEKTGWETMNVPALYKASDNRTGIEVWPHRDTPTTNTVTKPWSAAVGYANPDYYYIAYYIKPR